MVTGGFAMAANLGILTLKCKPFGNHLLARRPVAIMGANLLPFTEAIPEIFPVVIIALMRQ